MLEMVLAELLCDADRHVANLREGGNKPSKQTGSQYQDIQ